MGGCEKKIRLADSKGTFQHQDSKMERLVETRDELCLHFKSENGNTVLSSCNKQLGK